MKFQLYPHSTLFTSTEEKFLNINEMNIFLSLWYKYSSELPKVYELKQEKLYFTLPLKYE